MERKVTGNDNMFNKTRPQRQALLSHKRQQREAAGESERARSRMVCVNPSPPLLRWPSPWSTPEPGQSEAITPTINSCSASLSMQIEGGRRLGKLFTAASPSPSRRQTFSRRLARRRAGDLNERCPDHCQSNVILNLTPFPPSFCFTRALSVLL